MVAIEIGRVCKKLQGREAGRYCVVIDLIDESYVSITGPRPVTDVRRRQCNILHLEPTDDKLDIKKGASDEEVGKALEAAGLIEKVKSRRPIREPIGKGEKPKAEKAPKAKAEKPKAEKKEKPKAEKPAKPKAEKKEKAKK